MGFRAVAMVGLLTAGGCSFLLTEKLPDHYTGKTEPRCDTSSAPAVIDIIVSVLDVAGAAVAPNTSESVVSGLAGVLWAMSAMSGFSSTSECERSIDKWNQRQNVREREDEQREDELEELRRTHNADRQRDHDDLERLRREDAKRRALEVVPADAKAPDVGDNQEEN